MVGRSDDGHLVTVAGVGPEEVFDFLCNLKYITQRYVGMCMHV